MRLWLLIMLVSTYGVAAVALERDAVARGAGIQPSGSLGIAVGLQVLWLGALSLPFAAGGLLARDRDSGRTAMQRSRGISAGTLAAAHLSAATMVAVVTALVCATLIAAVAWALPAPTGGTTSTAVPFWHSLLDTSPAAWILVVAAVYALAGSALLSFSLLLATFGAGPRLCEIVPPLAALGLGFAVVGPLAFLNPLERLSFLQLHAVGWASAGSMIGYWGATIAVIDVFAVAVARKGGLA